MNTRNLQILHIVVRFSLVSRVNSGVKCNSVANSSEYTTLSAHLISTPILK